jgi:hypothetical protein
LLLCVAGVAACEEDGKTTPADCPALPLYDIQQGPTDDQQAEIEKIPAHCLTQLGHAVNQPSVTATAGTGGSSTGGSSTGGTTATDAGAAGVGGN